jgi:hypothetical protein
MKLSILVAVTIFVVAVAPTSGNAQVDSSLTGQRVRVRINDEHRQAALAPAFLELRGSVTAASPDSLTLRLPRTQTSITVPTRVMTGLAISRGVPGTAESGARGAAWGVFHGALLGVIYMSGPERNQGATWEEAIGTGASIGAVAGFLMGALSPHERWRGVKLR